MTGRTSKLIGRLLLACVAALQGCALVAGAAAQEEPGAVKSVEGRDEVRVLIEEVRLPVTALDRYGRFDPSLELEDLLVREDGVAQQLRSLYRIPASALVLLDTGGAENPAKSVRLTREVALRFLSRVQPDDRVALLQVSDRVELLHDWAHGEEGRAALVKALNNKLFPGKRTALAAGIASAVERLRRTPAGNRHLVMITEGVETVHGEAEYRAAVRALVEANVMVHVISYTSLARSAPAPRATRQRVDAGLPEELLMTLPRYRKRRGKDMVDDLRRKGGTTIAIERLFRRGGAHREAWERGELEMRGIAEETGGGVWLPASAQEMLMDADEAARAVGAQYVLTYRPQRPLASAEGGGEYRRVDVLSRRTGLTLRARRGYVPAGSP